MNIEFYNCPAPAPLDVTSLPAEKPAFVGYRPDFAAMEAVAREYAAYENILVIGHGGSVTSFYAFYNALRPHAKKRAHFLWTIDPDYIAELKAELAPENTVVLAVTKSGENTTQVEALSQFLDYPVVVVTGEGSSVEAVAEKMHFTVVRHPVIGGRFTAFTEVSLLPALLCGLPAEALLRGAMEVYEQYEKDSLAWKAASVLYQLERAGSVDVLGLMYSHYLFATSRLATQLCHESFGKDGQGQTYVFAEGSEVQHHTTQRLFGGRKNMAAWFFGLHSFSSDAKTSFPPQLHSIAMRGQPLFDLQNIPLSESQRFELEGTMEDARVQGLPVIHMELSGIEPVEIGRFMSFWQLYAVYASLLRSVNPFDQPQVEAGKRLSFNKRLAFKGLL